MCPEFFHIGPLAIRAYGVTLALSFLIGLWILGRQARTIGLNPDRIISLGFVLIIFGALGARLGFVLYHLAYFIENPLDTINPFRVSGQFGIAGLNLQGGLLGGFLAGVIYVRRHRIRVAAAFDAVAPAVAFGIFLTRIGCFLNGCCFGNPTSGPLGVHFPDHSPPFEIFGSVAIHPTQLYSSAYGLILFLGLWYLNCRWYRVGLATGSFLVVEAVFRFAIEPLRYYESEMILPLDGLQPTFNQIVALGMLVMGVVFLWRARSGTVDRQPGGGASDAVVKRKTP